MPVDGDLQVLGPQEPVKKTKRSRGSLTPEARKQTAAMRKSGPVKIAVGEKQR